MANPWFPVNSASAFSPSSLTPGDSRIRLPPKPPDPDPDNPLSLARFPPLNSSSPPPPKPSKTPRTPLPFKSTSLPNTESSSGMSVKPISLSPSSDFFRSGNTVQQLENLKILPPKNSSPINTNLASSSSSFSPIPAPKLPSTNPNPNPGLLPLPCSVPAEQAHTVTPQPPKNPQNPQPPKTKPTASEATPSNPNPNPSIAERIRKSVDKSLRRLAPVTVTDTGRPSVQIPDAVFQKGAELHKDFIICFFNGRPPPFNHVQNVLNHLWGKGNRVEIHSNPHTRSMLVRIPSDYLRQKILEKRVWYIGDSMFQAVQWTSDASAASPPLESIQIWAHLKDIPLDLRHSDGYSLIAGLVGEPKETDDFTLNLVSLSISHVKVAVDLTKPLPTVVEYTRESGEVVEVSVTYPWVPPTCSHCKELGHIMKNCLSQPPPPKHKPVDRKGKGPVSDETGQKPPNPSENLKNAKEPASSDAKEPSSASAPPSTSAPPASSKEPSSAPPISSNPLKPLVPPPIPSTPTKKPSSTISLPLSSPTFNHPPYFPPPLSLAPFVSPPSPPDHRKKRPRPCSSPTPSFTEQLISFSFPSSSHPPPLLLPPASAPPVFGPNPFAILAPLGPMPGEEIID